MLVKLNENIKLAIVGDIHESEDEWNEILSAVNPSPTMLLVSIGDVYDKGAGRHIADRITRQMMELQSSGSLLAVRGNHEAKRINKNRRDLSPELLWWKRQPLSITFQYPNGSRVTCLHGGVSPTMTAESICTNTEVLYLRNVDSNNRMIRLMWVEEDGVKRLVEEKEGGVLWHNLYDGRFGYIVSGHIQQNDGIVKLYNYSTNIDTAAYLTGILSCQIMGADGKERLIQTIRKNNVTNGVV
jgi:predicted phosphodiesterase